MTDPEVERIRKRHPDIPQDPLPFDTPEPVAKGKRWRSAKSAASVRFASCPKCLANREIGVVRTGDGTEVFRAHNKVIGKGRRMPCPGSGQVAPAPREPR